MIILAGGRSRRMKRDKASLPVPGGTLLEHVLFQVEGYFDEILISLSPGQRISLCGKKLATGRRPALGCIEDAVSGQGPMAGILAGLKAASHEVCAVIACDMPDIHLGLLRRLVRKAEKFEAVVPLAPTGLIEPLFAVYRRHVRAKMQKLLSSGQRSLLLLLDAVRTCRLPVRDTAWLKNLNTPQDYRTFLKSLKTRKKLR